MIQFGYEKQHRNVTIPKTEYEKLLTGEAELRSHITELNAKVEWLMEQFRLSPHRRFGASSVKSVQGEQEQLTLFNEEEIVSDILIPEPELIEVEKHFRKRKNMVNQNSLSDDLPIEVIEHVLPKEKQVCPECSGDCQIGLLKQPLTGWNRFTTVLKKRFVYAKFFTPTKRPCWCCASRTSSRKASRICSCIGQVETPTIRLSCMSISRTGKPSILKLSSKTSAVTFTPTGMRIITIYPATLRL